MKGQFKPDDERNTIRGYTYESNKRLTALGVTPNGRALSAFVKVLIDDYEDRLKQEQTSQKG